MRPPHDRSELLQIQHLRYRKWVRTFLENELLTDGDDRTFRILFPRSRLRGEAKVIVRKDGILAGREELEWFFSKWFEMAWEKKDGEKMEAGSTLLSLRGDSSRLLKAERVFLNILSRMSGIATLTASLVKKLPAGVFLAATRKTNAGLLDKKAVAVGGGLTHRLGLSDAVLMKENHLALLKGGVEEAGKRILSFSKKTAGAFWEIEVENRSQLDSLSSLFSKHQPRITGCIMLDNFTPEEICIALSSHSRKWFHDHSIFLEASGGIRPENIATYAKTGVDVLSCGFLTHSAPSLDFSMRMIQQ